MRCADAHAPRGLARPIPTHRLGVQAAPTRRCTSNCGNCASIPRRSAKRPAACSGGDSTLRVFYYRSDNLSDEHKERIVDFRNYDNSGRWYVLLDEAHKGGAEDTKRKHIFNILSRAGFLFNFSATFVDTLDLATTVHNFNLSEFISQGYGKHIAVLKQELAAFKKSGGTGDYTDDEKRKVVAKSMLLVAYTARKVRALRAEAGEPRRSTIIRC